MTIFSGLEEADPEAIPDPDVVAEVGSEVVPVVAEAGLDAAGAGVRGVVVDAVPEVDAAPIPVVAAAGSLDVDVTGAVAGDGVDGVDPVPAVEADPAPDMAGADDPAAGAGVRGVVVDAVPEVDAAPIPVVAAAGSLDVGESGAVVDGVDAVPEVEADPAPDMAGADGDAGEVRLPLPVDCA